MSNKNTYLFTLTITPVQSFISQARKTKDLFVGSEILSSLIREALKRFDEKDRIFPQKPDFVSNKFVVKLESITEQELKKLEESINNQFYLIGSKTLLDMKNITIDMKLFQDYFKPQMCNFFKIFWVAIEYDKSKSYQENYRKLEQNLGAVKNLRTFTQLEQEEQESGRKCSLCGERNGLFYSGKKPKYIIKNAINIKNNQIQKEETLCSVCFTKRFYNSNSSPYPSTAKIALLDWLKDIDYEELKNLKDENSEEFDEQWFIDSDKQEIKDFIKNNDLNTSTQKKYYALIQFDIDDMGKKLSSLDEEGQKELSKALAEFGKKAKSIVDKSGKTIYAGGDDFLGFVNLEYLFEVLKEIKEAFKIENLTYSTSIIIAHYKAPLHKVLDFSRELLAETKSHFKDKNGVGIVVLSNSAINAKTICRYENLELLKEMQEQKVGMSLHYKLHRIFSYLDNMSYDEFLIQKEMIKVEIKRVLKKEEDNFNEKIYNSLIAFFDKQKIEHSTNSYDIDFDNFIGYLKTIEQLRKVL